MAAKVKGQDQALAWSL